MIWNIIEALALIGSLAAWLVTWSKLDEQKKLTQEGRDRRWDEISRAAGLENDLEFFYQFHERVLEIEIENRARVEKERDALQDKLSAILCPTNNHVWRDGRCAKCGRVKDD